MPVAPVMSANSQLILVDTLFNHCALPQPPGALAVVGMNRLQPTKLAHLVFVLSGKLLPARVDKETLAPRGVRTHPLGARTHERTVVGLTPARGDFLFASLLHQHRQPHQR